MSLTDRYAEQLRTASGELADPEHPARGRRWRPRRRRGPLVMLGCAVLTVSSAAAAVVVVTGSEPSRPLVGTTPGFAPGLRGYRVDFAPDLRSGAIGWCGEIFVSTVAGGRGCGPAATAGAPVIAGGGLVRGTPPGRGSLNYRVVAGRVAAIGLADGRRIQTKRDLRVPAPWRVAVWTEQPTARPPVPPPSRTGPARTAEQAPVVPLDAAGRSIADPHEQGRAGTRQAGTRRLPAETIAPTTALTQRPCLIMVPRTPGIHALAEQVITRLPARVPDVAGRPFLSCAAVVVYASGTRYHAALLLDARRPRRATVGRLPGLRPAATRGLFTAQGSLTARRAGRGWLVVFGADPAGRANLITALAARVR